MSAVLPVAALATISKEDALEYIQKHAEHAVLEKRLDVLKKSILDALVAGAKCPTDLPALLVNRPQARSQPDWKGFAHGLLQKLYKRFKDADVRAAAELAQVDASWPTKDTPALHVVVNPTFVREK